MFLGNYGSIRYKNKNSLHSVLSCFPFKAHLITASSYPILEPIQNPWDDACRVSAVADRLPEKALDARFFFWLIFLKFP